MAFLGDLLIRMRAETADFQADMGKAAYVADKSMRQIKSAAASLFAVLGAGSFVALIKGSIDAADKLQDLNKSTGIAVEQLAGLSLASRQSGGDLNSIAASINKLSQNIGKDADKFAKIGISAKDPLEAFKQLADVFVSIQDPQTRAAVAAEALGKSWAGAAPLLSEGGKRIGEMVQRGSELSGVTQEITQQADAFNDKLAELVGTGGMLTRMVGPLLPLLNSFADDMLNASDKTRDLTSSFSPLAEAFRAMLVLGGNVSFVLKGIGTEIGGIMAQLAAIGRGDFGGVSAIRQAMIADAERSRADFDAWEGRVMGLGLTGKAEQRFSQTRRSPNVSGFLGGGAGISKAAKVNPAIELAIRDEQEFMRKTAEATQEYYAAAGKESEAQIKFMLEMEATSATRFWGEMETDFASAAKELDEYLNKTRKTIEVGRELGMTFSSAFEDAILHGKRFQDVLKGIAQDILRIIARKAVTEPIASSISNMFSGFNFGSFFRGGSNPVAAFATGTDYVPRDGFAYLHKGEAVTPASETGMGGVTFSPNIYIDSRTDSASIARTVDSAMRVSEARLIEQLNRGQGGITQAVRRA